MKTDNEILTQWRAKHHKALETLATSEKSGVQLWRECCRLEHVARQITTAACNGEAIRVYGWPVSGRLGWNKETADINFASDYDKAHEFAATRITDCIRAIFGTVPAGFFINWDARGAALKLNVEQVTIPEGMHTDWGRDGILAAQIN